MRPLIIGEEQQKQIDALVIWASANKIPGEDVLKMIAGSLAPIGDNPKHVIELPLGFRCVYSVEFQPLESKWFRHLSVSVPDAGRAPNMPAIEMIAAAFGFDLGKPKMLFPEDIGPNRAAINLMQPL